MSLITESKTDISQCKSLTAETAVIQDLRIQGIFTILGDAEIDGSLNVTGDFSVDTAIFTVDAATGNTVVGGTLDVDDATNITSTLGVTGASTLDSMVVTNAATVGTTLGVTNLSTLASMGVTTTALVGTTLGVTGLSTLASLGVTTTATVGTTLTVTGTTTCAAVTSETVSNTVIYGLAVLTGAGTVVIGNAPTDERPSTAWGSTTFAGTQTSRVAAGDYTGAIKVAVAGTYLVWISGSRVDVEDASVWGLFKATTDAGVGAAKLQSLAATTGNAAGQFAMLTIATLVADGIVYPAQTSGVAVSMYAVTASRSAIFGCIRLGA